MCTIMHFGGMLLNAHVALSAIGVSPGLSSALVSLVAVFGVVAIRLVAAYCCACFSFCVFV